MKVGSLFSGIGGLELGVLMANPSAEVAWQAECDPYALAVLAHHWPTVKRYIDVREIDETAIRVDVICGGFPCQPHSVAGKRRGTSDGRWIWPEFARIVDTLKPSAVFIENVPGLRTSGLQTVLADLASLGFDAEWDLFSAEETGAHHRRNRLFVLAYSHGEFVRYEPRRPIREDRPCASIAEHDCQDWYVANTASISAGEQTDAQNAVAGSRPAWAESGRGSWWATEPDVGRVADGVPTRAHRLRLLGNSVVPQQAALAWRTLIARSARR